MPFHVTDSHPVTSTTTFLMSRPGDSRNRSRYAQPVENQFFHHIPTSCILIHSHFPASAPNSCRGSDKIQKKRSPCPFIFSGQTRIGSGNSRLTGCDINRIPDVSPFAN